MSDILEEEFISQLTPWQKDLYRWLNRMPLVYTSEDYKTLLQEGGGPALNLELKNIDDWQEVMRKWEAAGYTETRAGNWTVDRETNKYTHANGYWVQLDRAFGQPLRLGDFLLKLANYRWMTPKDFHDLVILMSGGFGPKALVEPAAAKAVDTV